MSNSANNSIPYVPQDTLDPAAGLNLALRIIDALLNTRIEDMSLSAPPGSPPADGAMYVVKPAGTGDWAGHDNAIAQYDSAAGDWVFYEAGVQAWLFLNKADSNLYKWDATGSTWVIAAGIGDAPNDGNYYGRKSLAWSAMPDMSNVVISVNAIPSDSSGDVVLEAKDIPLAPDSNSSLTSVEVAAALEELSGRSLQTLAIACSDEKTALTAGVGKVAFRNPYSSVFHVTAVKASLTTAQATGTIFTVDINEAGVSILSTKLTIDNTEKTSATAAVPPVVSDADIAADAEITVDIDQIGDGTATGLKVYLIGHL
jgi:hypothetical protein